jgi:NitT/TauT family transport system permease protein
LPVLLALMALAWELHARHLANLLLVSTLTATRGSWLAAIASGELPDKAASSIRLLLQGYAAGHPLALLLTGVSVATRIGNGAAMGYRASAALPRS